MIRPVNARNVFHRKRDADGKLERPNGGILYNKDDGFNFGYNTLFWGNANHAEERIRQIYAKTGYFTHESPKMLIGQEGYMRWNVQKPHWTDYEVFQLSTL